MVADAGVKFQSAPGFEAGRSQAYADRVLQIEEVSIRARL